MLVNNFSDIAPVNSLTPMVPPSPITPLGHHIYPANTSTYTYPIDTAMRLFKETYQTLKEEPSTTWLGKFVFGHLLGWENKKITNIKKGQAADTTPLKQYDDYTFSDDPELNCTEENSSYSQEGEMLTYTTQFVEDSEDPSSTDDKIYQTIVKLVALVGLLGIGAYGVVAVQQNKLVFLRHLERISDRLRMDEMDSASDPLEQEELAEAIE